MTKRIIELEKDIPLEMAMKDGQWMLGRPRKYPFDEMEVGESFKVECPPEKISYQRHRILVAARAHSEYHKLGRRYISRKVDGGCRIWRVE